MIPTKESPGFPGGGLELDLTVDSDAALLQQRMLVAKLSREEVEDRYLRLLEENTLLKKHACKQEEKIKKLATKLIRVISEKKRMEVASGGPGKIRDIETEELIEDQQQRIRELDQENKGLKEKLLVAKNQLVGTSRPASRRSPARRPLPPRAPSHMSQVVEYWRICVRLKFVMTMIASINVRLLPRAPPPPPPRTRVTATRWPRSTRRRWVCWRRRGTRTGCWRRPSPRSRSRSTSTSRRWIRSRNKPGSRNQTLKRKFQF